MIDPKFVFGRLGNSLFQYAYIYAQARRGEIPDIFIQNPAYFDEYADELKNVFGTSNVEPIDMVAIHVRRGVNPLNPQEPKYCENDFYVNLMETPYYRDAMAQFIDEDFLIFSDDIEWCKQQKMFKDCEFSEGKTGLEDMHLMASCMGHIIANSSFSWWGAFLAPYTQKVVAPKAWYSDGVQRTSFPQGWLVI